MVQEEQWQPTVGRFNVPPTSRTTSPSTLVENSAEAFRMWRVDVEVVLEEFRRTCLGCLSFSEGPGRLQSPPATWNQC